MTSAVFAGIKRGNGKFLINGGFNLILKRKSSINRGFPLLCLIARRYIHVYTVCSRGISMKWGFEDSLWMFLNIGNPEKLLYTSILPQISGVRCLKTMVCFPSCWSDIRHSYSSRTHGLLVSDLMDGNMWNRAISSRNLNRADSRSVLFSWFKFRWKCKIF
jgi:hypothetical protein